MFVSVVETSARSSAVAVLTLIGSDSVSAFAAEWLSA